MNSFIPGNRVPQGFQIPFNTLNFQQIQYVPQYSQLVPINFVLAPIVQVQKRVPIQILQINDSNIKICSQQIQTLKQSIAQEQVFKHQQGNQLQLANQESSDDKILNFQDQLQDLSSNLIQVEQIQQESHSELQSKIESQGVNESTLSKQRREINKFKLLCVQNSYKNDDEDSNVRSDVLYKTIIRDMRKFFSKDFNTNTMFIKRKRYKNDQYFFSCIHEYLNLRFSEFSGALIVNPETQSLYPSQDFNDLIYFLGCLLYPKDIENAMKPLIKKRYDEKGKCQNDSTFSSKFNTIHSYLYSFSLEKLNHLVNLQYFAYFFCYYYQIGIVRDQRLERKETMNKHLDSYIEACNLILQLCKETLRSSLKKYIDKPQFESLQINIQQYLEINQKNQRNPTLALNNSNYFIKEKPFKVIIPEKRSASTDLAKLERQIHQEEEVSIKLPSSNEQIPSTQQIK